MQSPQQLADIFRLTAAFFLLLAGHGAPLAHAQAGGGGNVRPTPPGGGGAGGGGNAGGGGVIVPPGGGGGIIGTLPVIPGLPTLPTVPGAAEARIVGDSGILVGGTGRASVVLPTSSLPPIAASSSSGQNVATISLYRWTISGGRITSDSTAASVSFTADAAGMAVLNVTVIADGTSYTPTAQVAVLPANAAGAMTVPSTAATSTTPTLAASVTPATNNDRTFRWASTGGASIASGQGTASATFRPGPPGVKEISCVVTLQSLVTVTLRSFVVVMGNGPAVAVTVTGGSGGGTFPAGSLLDIFADPPRAGEVFDRWVGDVSAIASDPIAARMPHLAITVPTTPVALTATYKPAAEWTPVTVTNFHPQQQTDASGRVVNVGTTLMYYAPANARGLVWLLHDAGGTAAEWYGSPEALLVARDLVAAGYAVAALNSINRISGAWAEQATVAANPDVANLVAAVDYLAGSGRVSRDKPVFLLGAGDGAEAAARYAELLVQDGFIANIRGTILFSGASTERVALTSTMPAFFALAANDVSSTPARANARLLAGRGVATSVVSTAMAPVPPAQLRVLSLVDSTVNEADVLAIWTALRGAAILDENSYVRSLPTVDALRAILPAAHRRHAANVAAQLAVGASMRAVYSQLDAPLVDFINERAEAAAAPAPARIVNVSARTKIAFVGDAFTFGFTLTGRDRATMLVRAVGPSLARFAVRNPSLAARLEVYRGSTPIAANQGWDVAGNNGGQVAAASNAVGAFPLPAGALDAALLLTLDPGSYVVMAKGVNGTIGEVLLEAYDVTQNGTRISQLSTLARIDDGATESVLPGIVLRGANPRTLLVRAVGPGLASVGLAADSVLPDPRLSIFAGAPVPLAGNNNWTDASADVLGTVFSRAGAFPLGAASRDAALVSAFNAGAYTIQASSTPSGGTAAPGTGTVLVEVYEVP